jgi:hypothetical protein
MAKGGRPMLMDAVRYACGQINKAETNKRRAAQAKEKDGADKAPPSFRVKRNRDIFNVPCFKGGGQGNHAGDAIGQLWLLGKLDITGFDDTKLLDAARIWWHGRGIMFKGLDYKTAAYERASRTSNSSDKMSKPEREYARYNSFLLDASDFDQDCFADLMDTNIDGDFPCWVARIIQTELLRYIRIPLLELACDADYHKLEAAKRGLLAMAGAEARIQKREAAA